MYERHKLVLDVAYNFPTYLFYWHEIFALNLWLIDQLVWLTTESWGSSLSVLDSSAITGKFPRLCSQRYWDQNSDLHLVWRVFYRLILRHFLWPSQQPLLQSEQWQPQQPEQHRAECSVGTDPKEKNKAERPWKFQGYLLRKNTSSSEGTRWNQVC